MTRQEQDEWDRLFKAMLRAAHVDFNVLDPKRRASPLDLDRMEYERDEGPDNDMFYVKGQ